MKANDFPLPPRLHHSTIFMMVRLMKEGYRRANNLFAGHELRLMHYISAAYIAQYEGISQKTLSEVLIMDPSDVSSIVQDLEKAGYVERQPSKEDRRRFSLMITPTGNAWLLERDKGAYLFDKEFLAPLSPEERATFQKLLAVLLER